MKFIMRLSIGNHTEFFGSDIPKNVTFSAEVWDIQAKSQYKFHILATEEEVLRNFDALWSEIGRKAKALMEQIEGGYNPTSPQKKE